LQYITQAQLVDKMSKVWYNKNYVWQIYILTIRLDRWEVWKN
jgi:hypothetical protein